MKVKIEKYKNHYTCYDIAKKLCFWARLVPDEYGMKSEPDWVHHFGEWLTYGSVKPEPAVGEVFSIFNDARKLTWFARLLYWFQGNNERTIKIQIDPWDTWSMDNTLSIIILPMLKQLKETKHGSPFVDDEDVPEELKSTSSPAKENDWDTDENHFKRWDWVLDEMIWAFDHIANDGEWQEEFYSGSVSMKSIQLENGMSQLIKDTGPDAFRVDYDRMQKVEDRIKNGTRLFGKYYQALWD
jgi:hypothetical protein